jgi:integrase
MGRTRTPGIYPAENGEGWQINALYKGHNIRRRGYSTAAEAEGVLIAEKERIRKIEILGEAHRHTLDQAAAHYIKAEAERGKKSLETEIYLLKRIVQEIGDVTLDRISQQSVQPFIDACKRDGLKNKSINNALGVVIRICNLAARAWRDEKGNPWLMVPPLIRKLNLDDQRPPRPITWEEQKALLPLLPTHLAKMALFDLQNGARESVVCQLRWDWEVCVPLERDLKVSVFIVPKKHVKGGKFERVLVCNSVAQAIIDGERIRNGFLLIAGNVSRIPTGNRSCLTSRSIP